MKFSRQIPGYKRIYLQYRKWQYTHKMQDISEIIITLGLGEI